MADRRESGTIFGLPYNFKRPSIGRMLSAYWQPGRGMLVEKPFGIGYTLNLANWRSWVALAIVAGLYWQEQGADREAATAEEGPVEVIVDD